MSPDSTDLDPFLQMALSLRMLATDTSERLAIEAKDRRLLSSQLVLQKGLLTASQVDIVETLLRPDDAAPGYQLLNMLGHGGMGVVYRARQKNLNRIVAVKTVLVSQMGETSSVARFENEAQAVARLTHPHIVAAYDFGQHEGRLYFVMEYVEGEDVQGLIRRRRRGGAACCGSDGVVSSCSTAHSGACRPACGAVRRPFARRLDESFRRLGADAQRRRFPRAGWHQRRSESHASGRTQRTTRKRRCRISTDGAHSPAFREGRGGAVWLVADRRAVVRSVDSRRERDGSSRRSR